MAFKLNCPKCSYEAVGYTVEEAKAELERHDKRVEGWIKGHEKPNEEKPK